MAGGFKRSSRFGVIGVIVVMAVVAVIGLTMGSGEANPKLALGLIFGVVAVFCVILFALQRSDLERTAAANVRGTERAAAEGGEIENPTTMSEPELWSALAVRPIDAEAIRARTEMWEPARRSLRLGMVVTLPDLPHGPADLPARKLRPAADRRPADRDRRAAWELPRARRRG
jgi:hypothetical protein